MKQTQKEPIGIQHNPSPVVALIGKTPIRRDDLWASMSELSGDIVLEEFVLKHALTVEIQKKNIQITQVDLEREFALLKSVITSSDNVALENIFESMGVGPIRKSKLLWRNAALRKLISNQEIVNEEEALNMFELMYGKTYPVSVIVTTQRSVASDCYELLEDGELFHTVALEYSIDSSALRGGVVDPISPLDPAWPLVIREQLSSLELGQVSTPIFIGNKWILIKLIGRPIISNVNFEDVRTNMLVLVKQTKERILMDALSTELKNNYTPVIFDNDFKNALRFNANSPQ